jgi:hypothetical protein
MRKFKHKITGYIATETNSEKNYKVSEPKNFTIPKWIVEDSVDWEEIKEFPKIISYRAKYIEPDVSYHFKHVIESILKCNRYAYFASDVKYKYQDDPYYTDFEIYQVAISETETFTLGEKIYAPGTSYKGILNEFRVIGNNEFKIGIGIGDLANIYIDMCSIKKYKEPLFITEEGAGVNEGDVVYKVMKDTFCKTSEVYSNQTTNNFCWYFASSGAADQYVDENKPIYSKNQIKEAIESSFVKETYILDTPYCQIDRFKEDIFKQKLGL